MICNFFFKLIFRTASFSFYLRLSFSGICFLPVSYRSFYDSGIGPAGTCGRVALRRPGDHAVRLLRDRSLSGGPPHSRRTVRLSTLPTNLRTLLRHCQGLLAFCRGDRRTSISLRLVVGHLLVGDVRRYAQR